MISKSSYVKFIKCPKSLWLSIYKSNEESLLSEMEKEIIEDGLTVGKLALSYFPDTIDVSVKDVNGRINYQEQIARTKEALSKNYNCIAEASFLCDELFCAVDLLKKEEDGYSIYEVKSSLDIKDYQFYDISFQKYVLEKLGYKIINIYILHPNKNYIFHSKLDLNNYFIAESVINNEIVNNNLKSVADNIINIKNLLNSNEPYSIFSKECKECSFEKYCKKDFPNVHLGQLNGLRGDYKFFNENIFSINDYINTKEYKKSNKNARREAQIYSIINNNNEPIIDKESLKKFIENLKYPIYHLDFETTKFIVPMFDGFTPKESFPFQYSLHIEYEDGHIEHKEFLGEELNPTRNLAEQLIKDIPPNSLVLAYHASTEINVIKYLAKKFPDLALDLLGICNNFCDLLDIFKKGIYYDPKQGGSNSIKYVMPALCPYMEEAYHNLPLVHNGAEALAMFPKLIELKGTKEYNFVRNAMLEYCKLDTLSMVEILKQLRNKIK